MMLVIVVHTQNFKLYCGTGAPTEHIKCTSQLAYVEYIQLGLRCTTQPTSPLKTSVALQLLHTNPKLIRCNTHQLVLAWGVCTPLTHYIIIYICFILHASNSSMRLKGLVSRDSTILNCIIFSMITLVILCLLNLHRYNTQILYSRKPFIGKCRSSLWNIENIFQGISCLSSRSHGVTVVYSL